MEINRRNALSKMVSVYDREILRFLNGLSNIPCGSKEYDDIINRVDVLADIKKDYLEELKSLECAGTPELSLVTNLIKGPRILPIDDGKEWHLMWLVVVREENNVAFYDRGSGEQQRYNNARLGYENDAETVSELLRCTLVIPNRHQKTFCDIGTGARADNRPMLELALTDSRVDTIVAVSLDRLCRGEKLIQEIEDTSIKYNKNLCILMRKYEYDSWINLRRLFLDYQKEIEK